MTIKFRCIRVLPGVLMLLAGLLASPPSPAEAQNVCGGWSCYWTVCYTPPGQTEICTRRYAGCYGAYNGPFTCQCPIGAGSACYPSSEAFGPGAGPSEEDTVADGTATCHELLRLKTNHARGVQLFDRKAVSAVAVGSNRVAVSGAVQPKIPFEFKSEEPPSARQRFECEVERLDDGRWVKRLLEVSETQK